MIGIGIGCRSGTSKEAILALIDAALAQLERRDEPAKLFTIDGKRSESGLRAAAHTLAIPLAFLPVEALRAATDRVTTRSEAAQKALGVASVAEAAALAGCGDGAHLIVPRMTGDGVTCAIARAAEIREHIE